MGLPSARPGVNLFESIVRFYYLSGKNSGQNKSGWCSLNQYLTLVGIPTARWTIIIIVQRHWGGRKLLEHYVRGTIMWPFSIGSQPANLEFIWAQLQNCPSNVWYPAQQLLSVRKAAIEAKVGSISTWWVNLSYFRIHSRSVLYCPFPPRSQLCPGPFCIPRKNHVLITRLVGGRRFYTINANLNEWQLTLTNTWHLYHSKCQIMTIQLTYTIHQQKYPEDGETQRFCRRG